MNWWQIWAIVLIISSVGCFACAVLALWLMYRYKAEAERLHLKNGGLIIANNDLELELAQCQKEQE